MSKDGETQITRRACMTAGGAALLAGQVARVGASPPLRPKAIIRLSLNENAFGPSPRVPAAVARRLAGLERYVDESETDALARQIAAIEHVTPEQVVLGEVLEPIGVHLARSRGRPGTIVYSSPGYTALVDASAPFGGSGIAVPLNAKLENDLRALAGKIDDRTIAVNLVNPHNPSGTVNDAEAFDAAIREMSRRTLVVVDEAYLEYDDLERRSAIRLVREGGNVLVFRTLAKIYGLAGLAIGYAIAPLPLARALRAAGVGAPHSLNRLALVAAGAAIEDQQHVRDVRARTISQRRRLTQTLDRLGLERSNSRANFVFFRSPQPERLRQHLRDAGIDIGRTFPPLDDWIRITVGQSQDMDAVVDALHKWGNA